MKVLFLTILSLAAVFAVPFIVGFTRRYTVQDDVPIKKPRYIYLNADEALAQRATAKRQTAAAIRLRAAQVDSGSFSAG